MKRLFREPLQDWHYQPKVLGACFPYLPYNNPYYAAAFSSVTQISPWFSGLVRTETFWRVGCREVIISLYRQAREFKWRARSKEWGIVGLQPKDFLYVKPSMCVSCNCLLGASLWEDKGRRVCWCWFSPCITACYEYWRYVVCSVASRQMLFWGEPLDQPLLSV